MMKYSWAWIGVALLLVNFNSFAAGGWCGPTKVKTVETRNDGLVWFKFTNNTQFSALKADDAGLGNVLSLALTAYSTEKDVEVYLLDSTQCGIGGNATSWQYIRFY